MRTLLDQGYSWSFDTISFTRWLDIRLVELIRAAEIRGPRRDLCALNVAAARDELA